MSFRSSSSCLHPCVVLSCGLPRGGCSPSARRVIVSACSLLDGAGYSDIQHGPTLSFVSVPALSPLLLPLLSDRASPHRMCQWFALVHCTGPSSHRSSCSHTRAFSHSIPIDRDAQRVAIFFIVTHSPCTFIILCLLMWLSHPILIDLLHALYDCLCNNHICIYW